MSSPLAPESPRVLRRTAGDQRGSSGQQSPTHFAMDNSSGPSLSLGSAAYRANLVSHFAEDLDRRRRAEKALEEGRSAEGTLVNHSSMHLLCTIFNFHVYNSSI